MLTARRREKVSNPMGWNKTPTPKDMDKVRRFRLGTIRTMEGKRWMYCCKWGKPNSTEDS